jgi:hypothetical protein
MLIIEKEWRNYMFHVKISPDFSPEGAACYCLKELCSWTNEKFESKMKEIGQWELYLKFKQDSLEASPSSSE